MSNSIKESSLEGFAIRPITFLPTFQKQANKVCGGFQIHITDKKIFQPWRTGQFLMRELYHHLGNDFEWKKPPYEYDYTRKPIDVINGTDKLRQWVENNESLEVLGTLESLEDYKQQLNEIKIY